MHTGCCWLSCWIASRGSTRAVATTSTPVCRVSTATGRSRAGMPSCCLPSIVTESLRCCYDRPGLRRCRPALCDDGTSPVGTKAETAILISPGTLSPPGHGHKDIPLSRQQTNRLLPVVFLLLPALVGDRGSFCAREGRRADYGWSRSCCSRNGGR